VPASGAVLFEHHCLAFVAAHADQVDAAGIWPAQRVG
jgi:hypothetical protein